MHTFVITSTRPDQMKLPKSAFDRLPLTMRLLQSGALMTGSRLGGSMNATRVVDEPRLQNAREPLAH